MSTYGTLKAGSLILYEQVIQAQDVSLQDVHLQDLQLDGINRLRVTQAECVFTFSHTYTKESDLFEEVTVNGGTSTCPGSFVELAVHNTGDRVTRQSYQYVSCVPGGSVCAVLAGSLSTSGTEQPTGVRSMIGLFDSATDKTVDTDCGNGFFFQLHGGVFQVVRRSSTTVTPQEDLVVSQPDFSEDTLDGTGPSSLSFSATNIYAFVVDMTLVGCGYVRMGIINKNVTVYFHTFHCQSSSLPVLKSGSLPVRYEVVNESGGPVTDSVRCVAGSVWVDSGTVVPLRTFSYSTSTVSVSVNGAKQPVLSFRLKSSRNRTRFKLKCINTVTDGVVLWEVYQGGVLSPPSWTSVQDVSNVELDTSSSSLNAGRLLKSFYSSGTDTFLPEVTELYANVAGTSTTVSVCASKLLTSAVNVFVAVEWAEF